MRQKLKELYNDVRSVPAFSAKIGDFLKSHDLHSKNRRIVKRKFPRRKVIARFPFEVWMADTINYLKFKRQNDNFAYIEIMIDCFTRKLYAVPMKRIDAEHTADAFETVFKFLPNFPTHLVTDGGTEFFNSEVAQVMDNYGVNHYQCPTRSLSKASMAERVIRTLKTRISRYMQLNKTTRWIDILADLVENYNETPHSSTGFKPNEINSENQQIIYKKLYPSSLPVTPKLNIGDKVRKLAKKTFFEKGYTQNWSDEIYIVIKRLSSNGVVWYKISTFDGEALPGIFYYYQLNLVSNADQLMEN